MHCLAYLEQKKPLWRSVVEGMLDVELLVWSGDEYGLMLILVGYCRSMRRQCV